MPFRRFRPCATQGSQISNNLVQNAKLNVSLLINVNKSTAVDQHSFQRTSSPSSVLSTMTDFSALKATFSESIKMRSYLLTLCRKELQDVRVLLLA
jgi:hypothetical protein